MLIFLTTFLSDKENLRSQIHRNHTGILHNFLARYIKVDISLHLRFCQDILTTEVLKWYSDCENLRSRR